MAASNVKLEIEALTHVLRAQNRAMLRGELGMTWFYLRRLPRNLWRWVMW